MTVYDSRADRCQPWGYADEYEDEDEPEGYECPECGWEAPGCLCTRFADPGGSSALRAASEDNPRDRPCPTCGGENLLTREDVALGYQCDGCADRAERGGY